MPRYSARTAAALDLYDAIDPWDRLIVEDAIEAYHALPALLTIDLTADDWEAAVHGSPSATGAVVSALIRAGIDRHVLASAVAAESIA